MVMGIAVCGRHYTGMATIAIVPQATLPSGFMRSSMDAVFMVQGWSRLGSPPSAWHFAASHSWSATKHGRRAGAVTVPRFGRPIEGLPQVMIGTP